MKSLLFAFVFTLTFFPPGFSHAKTVAIMVDTAKVDEDSCEGCGVSGEALVLQNYVFNAAREACAQYNISVLLIPAEDHTLASFELDSVDGVILPHYNTPIDPLLYGKHNYLDVRNSKLLSSNVYIANVRAFLESGKPFLAINRGMHIMNIIYGGTLKNLPKNSSTKHQLPVDDSHNVSISQGSNLFSYLGLHKASAEISVNSMHSQVIDDLGQDLRVAAITKDGFIEAIEKNDRSFCLGVQWNPEFLNGLSDVLVFQSFCKAVSLKK